MGIVDSFEEDCISRIEAQRINVYIKSIKPDKLDTVPPASFFLMGLSFGVIVARVACTYGMFKN